MANFSAFSLPSDLVIPTSQHGLTLLSVVTDPAGAPIDVRFETVNQLAGLFFGILPARLVNRPYSTFFSSSEFNGLLIHCLTAFQSGEPTSFSAISTDFAGVDHTYTVNAERIDQQIRLTLDDLASRPFVIPRLVPVDVLNTLPDALCLLDPITPSDTDAFGYRFVNRAFETLWGPITDQPLPGRLYQSSPIDAAQPELISHLRQVAQTGVDFADELWVDNGTPTSWYAIQISRTTAGSLVMTLHNCSTVREILQRAETQNRSLQEAILNLERSNLDLAQFAQIASHDLQEPLRKIQVFSDLLQNQLADSLSEGERDLGKRLQLAAQRMQHMIRDLMNYSRLASDKASFVPVDLNTVLSDVLTDLDMLIADNGAVINVDTLPTISGNSSRLRQLFQNLIANALKFQPPGQPPLVHVTSRRLKPNELPTSLSIQPQRQYYLISVTDNGIGFDVEKYRSKLFRLFQRLHERKTYEGTGIGLAVAQRVAESHGGAVDVKSAPGKGSTFNVYLPA
jgi:signal transduction histidine kinase